MLGDLRNICVNFSKFENTLSTLYYTIEIKPLSSELAGSFRGYTETKCVDTGSRKGF
jgi:hypothetical protein